MTTKKNKSQESKASPPPLEQEYDSLFNQGVGFLSRFQRFTWDFFGVILLALALITLIALLFPQWSGGFLIVLWRSELRQVFGYGAILVAIAAGATGVLMLRLRYQQQRFSGDPIRKPSPNVNWGRVISLEIAAF
ncbi:MAG TPA: hypothetical protein VF831_12525, partial [Anaerolineales bacterium]